MLKLLAPPVQRMLRRRRSFGSYAALIETPGDLDSSGDGVVLPAEGTVFVSASGVLGQTTLLVDANTRHLGAPAAPAGALHCLGWFARGTVLKKHAAAPGTVRVYVQSPAGVPHLIAEA